MSSKPELIKIIKPQTPKEFEVYYFIRYTILRKPWNQTPGSEKDDQETTSIHMMALDEHNTALGVCRLQLNTPYEAQIRYMGVLENARKKGVGMKIIEYAENTAKENNSKKILLHAREVAIPFYEKCGYKIVEKSYLMWNEIQHYLMEKNLIGYF